MGNGRYNQGMSTQRIRAFIAIHLPAAAQAALGAACEALAAQFPPGSVRWVTPQNMHLTLRFLGDTAVDQLPSIKAALDQAAAAHRPLALQLGRVGAFPDRKRPRVIWVGLEGETERLAQLQQEVEDALRPLGWAPEERPFQAHVTLGRVKDSRLLAGLAWQVDVEKVDVEVTAVELMQSDLRPQGPIYTLLHSGKLQHE